MRPPGAGASVILSNMGADDDPRYDHGGDCGDRDLRHVGDCAGLGRQAEQPAGEKGLTAERCGPQRIWVQRGFTLLGIGRLARVAPAGAESWNPKRGMSFTSWQFAIFAAVVFAVYYLPLVRGYQVQWLVLSSLFFYG